MKFGKFIVEKSKFNHFSENEKVFFIIAGIMHNEISIIRNMIIANGRGPNGEIEELGRKARLYFFQILISGKLSQGWESMDKYYFRSKLSKEYDSLLLKDGKKALKILKEYFKTNPWLKQVRDKISHHYDKTQFENFILECSDDDNFTVYFGDTIGQVLFYYASCIPVIQSLKLIDSCDEKKATEKQLKDIIFVSSNLIDFISFWFIALAKKYGIKYENLEKEETLATRDEINFPFFFKP